MISSDKPSRWTLRRIIKRLFLSLLALFLASVVFLAAGAFIFSYWLKTADIKPAVKWVTAKITGGEVEFASVKADLTRGIDAKKIRLKLPSGIDVSVDRLDIGFDLRTLIHGALKIDHMNVDRPHITFADRAKNKGSAVSPVKGTGLFAIPAVPISISLRSLKVKELSFEYLRADAKTALTGLSLTGSGAIGPKGVMADFLLTSSQNSRCSFSFGNVSLESVCDVDLSLSSTKPGKMKLKGSAGLEIVSVKAPYKIDPGKVKAELDTDFINIDGKLSGRSTLKASLYGKPALDIKTDWKVTKGYLQYEGLITRLNIDLKHMPKIAGSEDYQLSGFASFSPATIKGKVALGGEGESVHSISGAGVIRASKFESKTVKAVQGATITAQLINLTVSPLKGALSGKALIDIKSPVIESSGVIADNLTVSIEANPASFSSGKIYVSASTDGAGVNGFQIGETNLNATLLGDFIKGDLGFIKTEISLLDKSRIAVFGSVLGFGNKGHDLTAEIQAPLKDIQPWLRKFTQVEVHSGQAQATIRANSDEEANSGSDETGLSGKIKIRDFTGSFLTNDPRSEIGSADLDLYFKKRGFGIDHFKAKLLGGGLTGAMKIKSEKEGYTLTTTEVFTGINLGGLLNRDLGLNQEESAIDGDMNIEIVPAQAEAGEEIDISKIELSINLSRIGSKALDRLFQLLDPNGSFTSVTNARKALENARPSSVSILISHGYLSVTIGLKNNPPHEGPSTPMTVIKKFPVARLVNSDLIWPYLSRFLALNGAMRLVVATHMKIYDNGAISFR